MASMLMPDINLRRRRRRLERHWRLVLHETGRGLSASRPLLAPSPPLSLDSHPASHPVRHSSASWMHQLFKPFTACLKSSTTEDDAWELDATPTRRSIKPMEDDDPVSRLERPLSSDNQDEVNAVDTSQLKLPSEPQTEPIASPMGLQPSPATACVPTPVPTKSRTAPPSSGPTLGDLMEAVARNETDMDELDFSFLLKRGKRLEADGCSLVARALETNRSVRRLVLREHDIGDRGAAAIASMLSRNATLQYVDLSGNNITDAGAEALAQALYGHAALSHLQLWSNRISDRGASALAEALKCNCSLLYLGLVDNSIAKDGAMALMEALDVNFQLETLNLALNADVPAWLAAQIRAVLARNRLEAPLMGEVWDSTAVHEGDGECVEESQAVRLQEGDGRGRNCVEEESGQDCTSSTSGSDASGFLTCSGATNSAVTTDGIWI